ncbi:hypothetical protein SEUCBS139899_009580 [Sporothrix eucalyptigena]
MSADEKVDAADVTARTVDSESGRPVSGEVIAVSNGDQPTDDELAAALRSYVPGTALEKKLVRKLDLMILPCLWWVYILAYLDRGNISNANSAGLSTDLGLTSSGYSLFIAVFFVGFFLFEIPSNLLMARLRPSIYLSTLMLVWGTIVAAMSTSAKASGFFAARFFLGCIEAGLFPALLYLLTCWYKKEELAKRMSLFFTAACISPALGGIMAGAIIKTLDGARGWEGWRWLFLIEGVMTAFFALTFYLVLVDYPLQTKRFSPAERMLAHVRVLADHEANIAADAARLTAWQAVKACLCDGRSWFFMLLYVLDCGSTCISYFIPTMIKGMGYGTVATQWMTVPIWIVGAVVMYIVSFTSDRTKDRRWHNTCAMAVSCISCIVCVCTGNRKAQYAMLCFMIAGLYSAVVIIFTWTSETIMRPNQKRSVVLAFVNSCGNLSIIYGSYLWPSSDAPGYHPGFISVAVFTGVAAILSVAAPYYFKLLPTVPSTRAERELMAHTDNGFSGVQADEKKI